MPKPSKLQIVTANDLMEGDVIYLTERGDWSREHGDAAIAETAEEAERLLALAAAQPGTAVGPYLAGAERDAAGRATPLHYREAIRTLGPTFRTDLGKQADAAASKGAA